MTTDSVDSPLPHARVDVGIGRRLEIASPNCGNGNEHVEFPEDLVEQLAELWAELLADDYIAKHRLTK